MTALHFPWPRLAAMLVLLGALSIAGCQSRGPVQSGIPDGDLRLIESGPLNLPTSCRPSGSVVVDFTVLASGQTENIRPAAAPDCVQQALTAWIASFRYAPMTQSAPATVEWMLVEARKGS